MSTSKPAKGPDSHAGRLELLARLQLMKAEVDSILWASPSLQLVVLFFAEVHGGATQMLSITAHSSLRKVSGAPGNIPKLDPRLEALTEIFDVAFELQHYGDFPKRHWLRDQLFSNKNSQWRGGSAGIERINRCDFNAIDLQGVLREAILAVANAEGGKARRRSRIVEKDVKDILITATDGVKAYSKSNVGSKAMTPAATNRWFSRRDMGLGKYGSGANVGDPKRQLVETRVRGAIKEAVTRGLLDSNGETTSARKYRVTDKGWRFAHATVQVGRLQFMLRQSSLSFRFVERRMELCAEFGARVVLEPVDAHQADAAGVQQKNRPSLRVRSSSRAPAHLLGRT